MVLSASFTISGWVFGGVLLSQEKNGPNPKKPLIPSFAKASFLKKKTSKLVLSQSWEPVE